MALSHLKPSERRAARVRLRLKKLGGGRPRLSVFRSAKNIYAQVIDDARGVTLAHASTLEEKGQKGADKDAAARVGALIATGFPCALPWATNARMSSRKRAAIAAVR